MHALKHCAGPASGARQPTFAARFWIASPPARRLTKCWAAQYGLNDLDAAIASLGRAARLDPASLRIDEQLRFALAAQSNRMGNALAADERLDEAVDCFRRALEFRPGYAEAHYNLANIYVRQARPDEAIDAYRRALELAPNLLMAYNNLAVAPALDIGTMKRLPAAAAHWRSTRTSPKSTQTWPCC